MKVKFDADDGENHNKDDDDVMMMMMMIMMVMMMMIVTMMMTMVMMISPHECKSDEGHSLHNLQVWLPSLLEVHHACD